MRFSSCSDLNESHDQNLRVWQAIGRREGAFGLEWNNSKLDRRLISTWHGMVWLRIKIPTLMDSYFEPRNIDARYSWHYEGRDNHKAKAGKYNERKHNASARLS